jgi:hypothetical protein
MKYAILLLCCAIMFACKKNKTTTTPVEGEMQYLLQNTRQTDLWRTDSVTIPVSVLYTTGKKEQLSLELLDVPQGVIATLTEASGTPPFTATLKLRTNDAPGGDYKMTLKSTTASGKEKKQDMTLRVLGTCAPALAGTYTNTRDTNIITTTIAAIGAYDTLLLQNLLPGEDFEARVNCGNKMIWLIRHDIPGINPRYVAEGNGVFNDEGITITTRKYFIDTPAKVMVQVRTLKRK